MRAALLCLLLVVPAFAVQNQPQSSNTQSPVTAQTQQNVQAASPASASQSIPGGFGLEDGTPVKLRLTRNLSSGTDKKGDTVDFEVVEDVSVSGTVVIPRGGVAWATITEAQPKRRMGRGGKLDVNIDSVRLNDGEKIPLRAVKDNSGGGHVGAMTGAMVATGIVFFPAAPLFLFMHGKDINIPKGTEITGYVMGNIPLQKAKFASAANAQGMPVSVQATESVVSISSSPGGADIEVDGKFVGNTPSSISIPAGEHSIKVSKTGFKPWERKLAVSGGTANVNAELEQEK